MDDSTGYAAESDSSWTYWRAVMEMAPGDMLIVAGKTFLLLAEGNFDQAKNLLRIARPFSRSEIPEWYFDVVEQLLSSFYSEMSDLMYEGIAAYDSGSFRSAQEIFERILEDYPNSAWARHELALTNHAINAKPDTVNVKLVHKCDPFFGINMISTTGKEFYLTLRRLELKEALDSDSLEIKEKLLTWADIALDLEQYAFAGQIYWLMLTHVNRTDDEQTDFLNRFIYCMRKLGIREAESNFVQDFDSACQSLDSLLLNRMINNPAYKMMAKPE
jgi:tetratricopeptide (TPR) repeat protein